MLTVLYHLVSPKTYLLGIFPLQKECLLLIYYFVFSPRTSNNLNSLSLLNTLPLQDFFLVPTTTYGKY